jgi:nucleoside-diphosphate-sugar epimerase
MGGTVLVTGAGGFIGSAVVRKLVSSIRTGRTTFWDGRPLTDVCAVVRPGGSLERLEEIALGDCWGVERVDMSDRSALESVLRRRRPKVVLHLAFDPSGFADQTEMDRRARHLAPLETLFEGLRGIPGSRVVHTSSAWVLAPGDRLGEGAPVQPRLEYAKTKALLDESLPALHRRTGVPWINLRLFNVFGRYENKARLLPYLVRCLSQGVCAQVSHGHQIRDFNDVDAIAQAYRLALQAPEGACGKIFHIGSARRTTVREFASMIADVTGNAHLIQFDAVRSRDQDIPCLVSDPGRAQRELGWTPVRDLEQRVRGAAEWWLQRVRHGTGLS